jgi:hypothetical protein
MEKHELEQHTEQPKQKRKEERIITELPVYLDGITGKTRDVSASGILFETDATYALGNSINFAVQFTTSTGKMVLRCQGEVVRIEPQGKKVKVAVKISQSTLEPVNA